MEPFDLTFHEVTSNDDLADPSTFDSFSNVINYETSFDQSGQSLPLSVYNTNTVQYCWKDYTYPTTSSIQTTSGGIPTGPSSNAVQHHSVWSDTFQGRPPHLSFLVHPDDSLANPHNSEQDSHRAAVTKSQLQVLAQISANTTAVTRQGKRAQRFVARTVTSPSTPIPPPSAFMSQPQDPSTLPPQGAETTGAGLQEDEGDGQQVEDSSFETVAEALRLQWSVIGNKNVAPVSADVVAQIVAEAERKMKAGDASPLPSPETPTASPTPFTTPQTALSTRRQVSPTVTTPQPVQMDMNNPATSGPHMLQEMHRGDCPRELTRIIPTEITTEKSQGGAWFSGAKSPEPGGNKSGGHISPLSRTFKTVSPVPSSAKPIQTSGTSITPTPDMQQNLYVNGGAIPAHAQVNMSSGIVSAVATDSVAFPVRGDISDSVSEASYSSELEMEKYLQAPLAAAGLSTNYQLESEEFLKSLPPIKPINLEAYATIPLLPPRPAVVHDKKQKSGATMEATPTRDKKSQKSKKNTPKSKETAAPEHTADTPVQDAIHFSSPPSSSSSAAPFLSPYGHGPEFSTPGYKVNTSLQEFSPSPFSQSQTQNSGYTIADQSSSVYHSALSSVDSPSIVSYNKKQFDEILKEKAKLLGHLEILTGESQAMLQERAELQAQLATLKARLASLQAAESGSGDGNLKMEMEKLRSSRQLLEQTILDANRMLSEKAEEIRTLQDELQVALDTSNKLQVRSQELRDDVRAKDMNIQALKNKIAELYVEVQTSIQTKMEAETEARTSRNDLVSLVRAKEWYQEQLQAAHDVRAKLQRELTVLQGQTVSHGTIVERLKSESARLRQQLAESQQRALKDKEMLARHLEAIQADMMEREAAFLEIQRERKLYEDTFNYQITTAEEEKSRLAMLQQATHDLEAQLDRAHSEAKKRHEQLVSVESGQIDVMKRLAVAGENLGEKEKELEEMEQKLIQMESQLQAVMSDLSKKDNEILKLKEEKASTEIALKSALQEKASVDKALEALKADMGKVEVSFKQMKQELNQRLVELQQSKTEKEKLQEELDRSQHELGIKSLSVNAMTRNFDGQTATQHGLEADKLRLEEELNGVRLKVQNLEYELNQKEALISEQTENINKLTAQISLLETRVEEAKDSVPADKIRIYENEIEDLRLKIRALEEAEADEANNEEKEKERMQVEITRLKEELLERQKAYEENVDILDKKLKELTSDKQQLETELGIARQSEELSQLEERDGVMEEMQSLATELRTEKQEKYNLEQQLLSLQASKAAEVEALQQKLHAQNESLQVLQSQQALFAEVETTNQALELELEKERGRVLGLSQKNTELKEHSHQLEAALAQRESALEDLKHSVEESTKDLEQRDQKFLDRIAGLEAAVEKEVEVQRDLRKQMGTKIMENKRLKKHNDGAKVELEQLKQDLTASQQAANQAMADLEAANQLSQSQLAEARESSTHAKSLETELERVKRDLEDNLARQPVLLEQIQSLEWQCAQKTREVEAAQEQIRIAEERAAQEVEAVKASLQEKQSEIDSLQAELSSLRQDKTQQRSQVNELRGALKASVQHHKLTKKLNEPENDMLEKGVQANFERKIVIPPLPFNLAEVEQLIQDTRVTPLDSKPLDQLSSCLSSLRAEISGLQKQMDLHTTTVHTSMQSWKSVESEVNDLNEVMRTIANTIIAANSTRTITMTTAMDTEQADILHV